MTPTLLQQLSLISYGNRFLRTGELPADYYPANPVFQQCRRVEFRLLVPTAGPPTETLAAPDPVAWLHALRRQGGQRLALRYRPAPGPLGPWPTAYAGGSWVLAASSGAAADHWVSQWEPAPPAGPGHPTWLVSYGRVAAGEPPADNDPPLLALRAALAAALASNQAFAEAQGLRNWETIFERAAARLTSPAPEAGPHVALLAPAEHTLAARQLLFAAEAAWVFGGMGSWSDQGFGDAATERRYQALAKELRELLLPALAAGINAPAPAATTPAP